MSIRRFPCVSWLRSPAVSEPIGCLRHLPLGEKTKERLMAVEAIWNDRVVAHSDRTLLLEGNHYFPREDVDPTVLEKSRSTSECPWKGTAHYYTLEVDGERNADAAWYYPEPKPEAEAIRDRIAFWNGVEIVEA